ncbi:MAG: xanthine dehydrogenase family protein molybdopterin-binding subunit [Burkholderiales bacterium]
MNDFGPIDFDAPNSYIGRSVTRPNARRLTQGRGQFVDDIVLPRMLHVAYVRSPHAHARIVAIDAKTAAAMPGVVRVATGADIALVCKPYVGVLTHLAGMRSMPQYPLAIDVARWQGEPVVAVVAQTRAEAEDAAEAVGIVWEELPAVLDAERALDPGETVIHKEFGNNLCFQRTVDTGGVDEAFKHAHLVVEDTVRIGRHTGVTLEPRAILADYNRAEESLTVYHCGQSPHMMQGILASRLSLDEHRVRIIARDVGGSFGIKIHTYGDEVAACALSIMLSRPVKFAADRFESFLSDIHARDHRVKARLAVDRDGNMLALEIDDLTGIGPFSMYPRSSGVECNQVLNLTGGPYKHAQYRAKGTVVFQNKNMMCQYRAVGHPVAIAVAEHIVDQAAVKLGLDPAEMRRRNLIADDAYPYKSPSGMRFEALSHHQCFAKLLELMNYAGLRKEQAELRKQGIYRGIGLSCFIEVTNPSPMFYGVGGARIAAQDGCTIKLDASGAIIAATGVTEQGQGTETIMAQIAATALGVQMSCVKVLTGDTDKVPYGGGTWASRAAGIGGEAVLLAGLALKQNILEVGAVILKTQAPDLDIVDGKVVKKGTEEGITLAELARIVYYRGNELPVDFQPELVVTRHFRVKDYPFVFTNGAQGCLLEVDTDTGFVKLLKMWCVDDCGRVINPKLVDEQVRGGMVQGIGGALLEQCLYDDRGQLLNCTLADYLVPMAAEMPDIETAHVETPTKTSILGAKGAGEAGTGGAPAAIMNAVNDALRPLSAKVTSQPITPESVLRALGKAR